MTEPHQMFMQRKPLLIKYISFTLTFLFDHLMLPFACFCSNCWNNMIVIVYELDKKKMLNGNSEMFILGEIPFRNFKDDLWNPHAHSSKFSLKEKWTRRKPLKNVTVWSIFSGHPMKLVYQVHRKCQTDALDSIYKQHSVLSVTWRAGSDELDGALLTLT